MDIGGAKRQGATVRTGDAAIAEVLGRAGQRRPMQTDAGAPWQVISGPGGCAAWKKLTRAPTARRRDL